MKRVLLCTCLVIIFIIEMPVSLFAENLIPAYHPYIQYYGRWDRTDSTKAAHSWSGVYISAKFEGTSIGVRLFDNFTYYNVFIDGKFIKIFRGDYYGEKSYTLIANLGDTVHTILLTKRCETSWSKFTFYGFVLDNDKTLLPPDEPPARKIEFVGDSYTSASGNEYTEEGTPPETELVTNTYESFGAIVSRHYDAQYTLSSCSGYGMVLDWQGNYANNIPDCYDRTLLYTASSPKWDYSQWIPNLVVIGLGLNDYSGYGGWAGTMTDENTAEYKEHYHAFIQNLRDYYPGAKILAVATHVEWMRTTIAGIVAEEQAAGHRDVFYAQYSYYEGGYVNNGHPNVETHYKIADELIAAIDTIDAWQPANDNVPPVFTKLPQSPFTVMDTIYTFKIETNSYATVRYSKTDKSYGEMEYEFISTGERNHQTTISCQQDQVYTYYLRACDRSGNAMDTSAIVTFSVDTMLAPVRWMHPVYPMSEHWKTGQAPLGYGYTDAKTKVARVNTAYFRKTFDIVNVDSISALTLSLYYDDAVAVYLNGLEIERFNLNADDTLRYGTSAMQSKKGITSYALTASEKNLLKNGQNLIAVEVHQYNADTTSMYFNCRLTNTTGGASEIIFNLGAEWQYFDAYFCPEDISRDSIVAVDKGRISAPTEFILHHNYPNPFNASTIIRYSIPKSDEVRLDILDCRGCLVKTLVNRFQEAGTYETRFDSQLYPSGIYIYRLKSGKQFKTGKMVLLK